ncbi:hypothetical protein Ptr902_03560 [Pyrenophora tritici-repentis]|uniref:Uncharacterized protein n=1 Tax=Pyrenophora tritici-repentis TaxID=45151 RepID=A0A5M9LAA5_9PLEO|nr:hypothetical protein PtrV1_08608 [Pyrenophora tritici-repentis]KAF7570227.1 hypothetical protein PtrM4_102290 [Pyrenophora tritici-repentis]KAI0577547.1 hypothetical protein Alg215_06852 [Pyrenophora tritici-repentis]KAI2484620.1 hypothetical protein Ptr902_03560 [Pyrenophora tritici-repentis]
MLTPTPLLLLLLPTLALSACCYPDIYTTCGDGTQGTPRCGIGNCNIFGCACDGGKFHSNSHRQD